MFLQPGPTFTFSNSCLKLVAAGSPGSPLHSSSLLSEPVGVPAMRAQHRMSYSIHCIPSRQHCAQHAMEQQRWQLTAGGPTCPGIRCALRCDEAPAGAQTAVDQFSTLQWQRALQTCWGRRLV